MKLFRSILTISLIILLQSCFTVTNDYKPNKRLIKKHLKNIESNTNLKLSRDFEVLYYHYFDNIEEFSIEFKLKYSSLEFNDYVEQLDKLIDKEVENKEHLNSSWTVNNGIYNFNASNSHMDNIKLSLKCDSNIVEYFYMVE